MAREKSGTRDKKAARSRAAVLSGKAGRSKAASGRKTAASKKPAADPNAEPVAAALSAAPSEPTPSPAAADAPTLSAAEPPPALAADEPVAFDDDGLDRVKDIIRNARATWFALLGALVFAAITLASVKDVAFFVSSVETKLPVVGISVPVYSFFWAGSLLIAALYAYFHLYLELLWQALGDAPARIKGKPLADRIDPWIVTDAALRLRDRLRGAHGNERASRKRAMQAVSDIVSFGLVWFFGLAVIFWFWWRSMPAHDPLLTGFIGIVFAFTLWVFCKGITGAVAHLADCEVRWRWRKVVAITVIGIVGLTAARTQVDPWAGSPRGTVFQYDVERKAFVWRSELFRPARANLREVVFTEKPKDWQGKKIAEAEFRIRWCRERGEPKCANPLNAENRKFEDEEEKAFQEAWEERLTALRAAFPKPDLRGVDWRGADLASAELEGADLSDARLDGADLEGARLDGANLIVASLDGANLYRAGLERADLSDATLERAGLRDARLEGAVLVRVRLYGADLSNARLDGTNLEEAGLQGADLHFARLDGANFRNASLEGANLAGAELRNANFSYANMKNANFDGAIADSANLSDVNLSGATVTYVSFSNAILQNANLESANLSGSGFTSADLKGAILNGADLKGASMAGANLGYAKLFGTADRPLVLTKDHQYASFAYSALRFVVFDGLSESKVGDFSTTFGDASVKLPSTFARPCQWGREEEGKLDDAQYFGRWRGWLRDTSLQSADHVFENHPAIAPPTGCAPKPTGQ